MPNDAKKPLFKTNTTTGEITCCTCGIVATCPEEYCEHMQKRYGKVMPAAEPAVPTALRKPVAPKAEQLELPGMPEKNEETKIAEDILDLKDVMAGNKMELDDLKLKLVTQMRLTQQSSLLVKGWVFTVELEDKLSIAKKKA